MRWPDDERLYLALVVVVLITTGLVYLGSLPRDPVHGTLAPTADAAAATSTGSKPVATTGSPAPPPVVALRVTVWPRGAGGPRLTWTVTCPPASGACRTAITRRALLMSERPGPCSNRSGRAEAVVVGRVAGRHVVAWLDQRDGCGVERWRALLPVLTARTTTDGGGKSARS